MVLNEGYRTQLAEIFKAVLAVTRETHVKQIEVLIGGMA